MLGGDVMAEKTKGRDELIEIRFKIPRRDLEALKSAVGIPQGLPMRPSGIVRLAIYRVIEEHRNRGGKSDG